MIRLKGKIILKSLGANEAKGVDHGFYSGFGQLLYIKWVPVASDLRS
jgi:hypothetical protein